MAPCSRRRALRLLGAAPAAGLTGCLGSPVGEVRTAEATPALEVSFAASVERSFAAEHPGRVRIELTNDGTAPLAMGVSHGIEGPFSAVEGEQVGGDATLVLLADPPGDHHETPPGVPCRDGRSAIPEAPTDGCWRPACEYGLLSAHYAIELAAGETRSWPYVVLDGFNDRCLPAGRYRFASTAAIAVGTELPGGAATTPPGGLTHRLVKRLVLELAGDGTLIAEATTETERIDAAG